ncbi:MAG: hypothetical protein M1450_02670 [Patescibacteria group bacterium]|nr:hypothetical protein [Patescibacteria group bacterium]
MNLRTDSISPASKRFLDSIKEPAKRREKEEINKLREDLGVPKVVFDACQGISEITEGKIQHQGITPEGSSGPALRRKES